MNENLAALVEALTAPGTPGELSGRDQIMAGFGARPPVAAVPGSTTTTLTPPPRRSSMLLRLFASKLALSLTAGAVGLGGTAAVAQAGALPAPLQEVAHATIGAPAPDEPTSGGEDATGEAAGSSTDPAPEAETDPATEPTDGTAGESDEIDYDALSTALGQGPDVAGPAAKGLCTAYEEGGLAVYSVAYRNLERAAADAGSVTAYCEQVTDPDTESTEATEAKGEDGEDTNDAKATETASRHTEEAEDADRKDRQTDASRATRGTSATSSAASSDSKSRGGHGESGDGDGDGELEESDDDD
jgi:E1A/CREB-binding protein